jgi:hypothetical protein
MQDGFSVARVVEVNKGNYQVSDGLHVILNEIREKDEKGRLRFLLYGCPRVNRMRLTIKRKTASNWC